MNQEQLWENLITSPKARTYLIDRKISLGTARELGIGYVPKNSRFSKFSCNSKYRDRLLFPIRDYEGQIVTYQGRALFDYKKAEVPKYWHSGFIPEIGRNFNKQEIVDGLSESEHLIAKYGFVVSVESQFCRTNLFQMRLPCVATMSANISDYQLLQIALRTPFLVTWIDPDNAGARLKKVISGKATKFGLRTSFVESGDDVSDTVAKYGTDMVYKLALEALAKT